MLRKNLDGFPISEARCHVVFFEMVEVSFLLHPSIQHPILVLSDVNQCIVFVNGIHTRDFWPFVSMDSVAYLVAFEMELKSEPKI